jgi:hypothetical protein
MQRSHGSMRIWGQQLRLIGILESQVKPSCNGDIQIKETGVALVNNNAWTYTISCLNSCAMCVAWILKGWHFVVHADCEFTMSLLHAIHVLRSRTKRSTRDSGQTTQIIDASKYLSHRHGCVI